MPRHPAKARKRKAAKWQTAVILPDMQAGYFRKILNGWAMHRGQEYRG